MTPGRTRRAPGIDGTASLHPWRPPGCSLLIVRRPLFQRMRSDDRIAGMTGGQMGFGIQVPDQRHVPAVKCEPARANGQLARDGEELSLDWFGIAGFTQHPASVLPVVRPCLLLRHPAARHQQLSVPARAPHRRAVRPLSTDRRPHGAAPACAGRVGPGLRHHARHAFLIRRRSACACTLSAQAEASAARTRQS